MEEASGDASKYQQSNESTHSPTFTPTSHLRPDIWYVYSYTHSTMYTYKSTEALYYMPFLCFTATKKQKSDQATTLTTETDKADLNMEVCLGANYYKTGADPEINLESEYPEWLWSLLERDQPAPDSKQHWRRVRKAQAHRVIATLNEKQ